MVQSPLPVPVQTPGSARVLIIDDHAILREGLASLIEVGGDFTVVGDAATLPDGVGLALRLMPDVVITDLSFPGATGLHGIAEMRRRCPSVRIIILTIHDSEEYIRAGLSAGANGYVLKDASRLELMQGLRAVLNGQRYLCAGASTRLLHRYLGEAPQPSAKAATMTAREREILAMIAAGQSNKRIALTIGRSVKTVEKHRANLMRKLGLHNAADVTRFALNSGILSNRSGADSGPDGLRL